MSNGLQVKRLSKVAKEFNIGIHTIVEFLESKNITIESNPNTKLDENIYAVLLEEFQSDKTDKEAAKKVSEFGNYHRDGSGKKIYFKKWLS